MKNLLLALVVCVFGFLIHGFFSCSSIGAEYPQFLCNPTHLASISHFVSNAFFVVNLHPFLAFLTPILPTGSYFILLLVWFVGGSLLYKPNSESAIISSSLLLLLFSLFGADTEIFHSIAWIPWIIWGIDLFIKNKKFSFLILLAVSVFHSFTALQSSILGVVAALIFASRFIIQTQRLSLGGLAAITIPSLLVLFFGPIPDFPEYPSFARVLSTIYPNYEPWFGIAPSVAIFNVPLIAKILFVPTLVGLLISLALAFKEKFSFLSTLTLVIFVGLFVESCLVSPDSGREIGLIATITRILPGFSFLPIHFLMFGFGVILISFQLSKNVLALGAIAASIVVVVIGKPILTDFHTALELTPDVSRVLQSPSSVILRENPSLISVLEKHSFKSRYRSYPLNKHPHKIEASHQNEIIYRIFTGDLNKRWSPMKGGQEGGEFIRIRFETPHHLRGLQISPGAFHGDYMRGVRIRSLPSCSKIEESTNGEIIYEQNPFQGDISWTADGFPYYDSPSKGLVHFKKDHLIQCVLIEQIGQSTQFDWSVSNIRFLQ